MAYTALAGFVGLALESERVGLDSATAILVSALLLMGSAAVHERVLRARKMRRFRQDLDAQREAHARLMQELTGTRSELALLHQALEESTRKRHTAATQGTQAVMGEIHMLRRLVDQLAVREGAAQAVAAAPVKV
ncbi:MAG: hypothetical protein ACREGL_01730, partial [Alphaproteobacteria bacterium]